MTRLEPFAEGVADLEPEIRELVRAAAKEEGRPFSDQNRGSEHKAAIAPCSSGSMNQVTAGSNGSARP